MRERIGKGGITEEREGEVTKPTEEVFGADRREAAAKPSPDLGGGFGGKWGVGALVAKKSSPPPPLLLASCPPKERGEERREESRAEQRRAKQEH